MGRATRLLGPLQLSGATEVRGVLGAAVARLGRAVVGGAWGPGEALPREADLALQLGTGRSVVREAVRTLAAKGLVRSRTSDGTRVRPRADWRLLDPDVMGWRIEAGDRRGLLEDLLRVRLAVEPGVAREAAERLGRDAAARDRLWTAWAEKDRVFREADADQARRRAAFIDTDLAFHRALLAAVGSELLDQLFAVTEAALGLLLDLQMRARGYADAGPIGMDESHALHRAVYEAAMAGWAEEAGEAMRRLIARAIEDAQAGFAATDAAAGRPAP